MKSHKNSSNGVHYVFRRVISIHIYTFDQVIRLSRKLLYSQSEIGLGSILYLQMCTFIVVSNTG